MSGTDSLSLKEKRIANLAKGRAKRLENLKRQKEEMAANPELAAQVAAEKKAKAAARKLAKQASKAAPPQVAKPVAVADDVEVAELTDDEELMIAPAKAFQSRLESLDKKIASLAPKPAPPVAAPVVAPVAVQEKAPVVVETKVPVAQPVFKPKRK